MSTNPTGGAYSVMLEPDMVASAGGGGGGGGGSSAQTDYFEFGLPVDPSNNTYPNVSYSSGMQLFQRGDRFGTYAHPDGVRTGVRLSVELPSTWTGAVDLQLVLFDNSGSGVTKWDVSTACWQAGSAPGSWSAAQSMTGSISGSQTRQTVTFAGVPTSSCVAGDTLLLKIERDGAHASDTYTDYAEVYKYVVIRRRSS